MAAREGEDPPAGLQRSRQPGPEGATPTFILEERSNHVTTSATESESHRRNAPKAVDRLPMKMRNRQQPFAFILG